MNDWIKLKGYQVSLNRTFLHETYPAMDQFDWLIIMGGTMSTNEEDKHRWLHAEKKFIRKSVESEKIVLGICFGAQLIAEILEAPEQVRALLDRPVFHWHGDTFDLPDGAIRLASSEATINQAFLYKDKVMALQYHHEVTRDSIGLMLDNLGWQLKKDKYVQSAEEIIKGTGHISENNRIMFKIMDYLDGHK